MADPSGPAAASRRDLPRRGLYPPETDEGPRQAGIHAVLYVFHLAHPEVGAGAISDRVDAVSRTRFLSSELLRQHARYSALSLAERRTMDVQVPRCAGGHAVRHLRRLQWFRTA